MKKLIFFFLINLFLCNNMDYIIDNIYLGDYIASINETLLKEYNITSVINCALELPSEYEEIRFLELQLDDSLEQPILPKFEVAYKFIKINSENNILIHCGLGMSRSASVVLFYLMKDKGWDYDTSFNYTKERRPEIGPSQGFEQKLRDYYEQNIKK